MIRTALAIALLTTPAAADQRAGYWDAPEAARQAYLAAPTIDETISRGIDILEADGTLSRYVGDTPSLVAPNFITVYNHTAGVCHWGFDTNTYPAIDGTVSLVIRDHAIAQNWPADTIEAEQGRIGAWIGHARLATTIGRQDHSDALRFGSLTLIFGLSLAEGTS